MRISKSGNSYKIKCSDEEYQVLKYCVFEINPYQDDFMHDYVMETSLTDEEIDDVARALKGTD